jgi:hypothetical protein
LSCVEFAGFNVVDDLFSQRLRSHIHSVVFVGRLCESHSRGFFLDSLTV